MGTPEGARQRLWDLVAETPIDRPLLTIPEQAADELAEGTNEVLAQVADE